MAHDTPVETIEVLDKTTSGNDRANSVDVGRRDGRNTSERAIYSKTDARAGHDAPTRSIKVLDEWLPELAALAYHGEGVTHRVNIAGGKRRHCLKVIAVRRGAIRSNSHRPQPGL